MAVEPVFVKNLDNLKASLRLSGTAHPDANQLFLDAATYARTRLYSRMGSSGVDSIKATALTDNPSTDAQVVRAKAARLETLLVRLALLPVMDTLFADSSAQAQQTWNETGVFSSQQPTSKEIARLEEEIEDLFAEVSGSESSGGSQVSVIGPDTPNLPIGSSIYI